MARRSTRVTEPKEEVKVEVKAEVSVSKIAPFIEEEINFKPGQKFPTPSPGNGGKLKWRM